MHVTYQAIITNNEGNVFYIPMKKFQQAEMLYQHVKHLHQVRGVEVSDEVPATEPIRKLSMIQMFREVFTLSLIEAGYLVEYLQENK